MPDITERKIKEAWTRFRPTGHLFNFTEKRPMRVRMALQGDANESEHERPPCIIVELFLESGGLSGLPVYRIIGAVPHRNLKITLETIFDSGYSTPGHLSVRLN